MSPPKGLALLGSKPNSPLRLYDSRCALHSCAGKNGSGGLTWRCYVPDSYPRSGPTVTRSVSRGLALL